MTAEVQDVQDQVDGQASDLDLILPEGSEVTVGGIRCRLRRLKTREFLALMRVITNGIGPNLSQLNLDTNDEEQMKADLIALVTLAMPNAAEEFVDFLGVVVDPVSKSDRAALAVQMKNPDPLDSLDLLGVLIEQEAGELSVLAGKARAWMSRIQKAFRKQTPTG